MTEATSQPAAEESQQAPAPRPKKRDVHGWVVLDKPVGMTSTHAVAVVKRAFSAKKAGHAGTLDPLASGLLPIALGEATKTVPFVMDGRKAYEFTVAWGSQTDTDDTEGRVVATSEDRPDEAAIAALLPRFTGTIQQVPPKFSAIKIAGERAYDLARDGEEVTLQARPVEITALRIVRHDGPTTTFEAECGKGTYVRAIARDLGLALGCLGHVAHLRRTRVGPFAVTEAATVEALRDGDNAAEALLPVSAALALIPEITVHRDAALRLKRGQSVLLRGRDAPLEAEAVYAVSGGVLIATGSIAQGEFVPHRVFNL
ncbi:tRNA pseudouridine(55) synthase TruB [Bosea vestrisii]|uniref:tRNA pseudouridine(55) synthase TruB n=1 Tax=Bosea vestrisii TaxID=151416 RepID=UPI0024E02F58|nr:tRNA pseudouridine(55) synthase TruB [Bosea vestrisii]WID94382.1 tRNA pseudouridine(55) synthase TruB [Bosea vestrisii]